LRNKNAYLCVLIFQKETNYSDMKLLLISNSTNPGEAYLSWPQEAIKNFLGETPVTALFIPYAAVTFSFDEYEAKVANRFSGLGHPISSIHHAWDPVKAVEEAQAIVVGGGNTWQLVQMLHDHGLMEVVRQKVEAGTPYIGWSAGSNVACPSLRTTNDMPIVDPHGFNTLNLIPFQINPHYLDVHPEGFGGETREMRINEFIEVNPDVYVLGLRESTLLKRDGDVLKLVGNKTARLFKKGETPRELSTEDDLSFLLNS
jgi:dipeptidase E